MIVVHEPTIKCVVWDLDGTIWEGVLLEGGARQLMPGIALTLTLLDQRGILHSIVSRNDAAAARQRLCELHIDHMFVCPQIGWDAKPIGVSTIARSLNIALGSVAFIDDDPFERDDVAFAMPDVRCYPSEVASDLPELSAFKPAVISPESPSRRLRYQAEARRDNDEQSFVGSREAFLSQLGLTLEIRHATHHDLERTEELTVRTHQLNTTGRTYSRDELRELLAADDAKLLLASLEDRYGTYGTVGLAVITGRHTQTLRLFLMSCRVMSRGVGSVFLSHLMQAAALDGQRLLAEVIPTSSNRMMIATLRLLGFEIIRENEGTLTLEASGTVPQLPPYVELRIKA